MRALTYKLMLFLAGFPAAGLLSPAQAQENLPAMTFDSGSLQDSEGFVDQDARPSFTYRNPYLNDTLILQYQNELLKKMVQRQTVISRTEQSFMDVGIPFEQPPPPRGICEQIPANVPCLKAYPDLYPGAVAHVRQIEDGALDDAPAPVPVVLDEPVHKARPVAVQQQKRETAPDFSAYKWAEITCAGGRCAAVITKNGVRRSVREGDALDDGLMVTRINALGVVVSKDGKTASLGAALAPSRGGSASPKYAAYDNGAVQPLSGSLHDQSRQIEQMFGDDTESGQAAIGSIPAGEASQPPPAPMLDDSEPVSDPGPPLGPTGLY